MLSPAPAWAIIILVFLLMLGTFSFAFRESNERFLVWFFPNVFYTVLVSTGLLGLFACSTLFCILLSSALSLPLLLSNYTHNSLANTKHMVFIFPMSNPLITLPPQEPIIIHGKEAYKIYPQPINQTFIEIFLYHNSLC